MLSSTINPDDVDDEDEPDMPGDYEPWPRVPPRTAPPKTAPPPRNAMRSPPRPRRRSPPAPPKSRPPVQPPPIPVKSRRRRSRPLTPEIIIDRRHGHSHHHHHHHHHRSSGRNRIITIPLDNRPTLGLRGLPRQVLEIERVRCRRRRRCRSPCYEIDYHVPPPPPPMQPQPNVIFVNPTSDPLAQSSFLPSANSSSASLALLSTLTPEMIENLPKRTVHLPPIHLPGSQADATTKLQTVVFPAELINPIDGTLSIIQSNSTSQSGRFPNLHYPVSAPVQPQFIHTPINTNSPLAPLTTLSGPFMEQVHDLVQKMNLSQRQPIPPYSNQTIVQPSSQMIPQYNAQTVPSTNALNTGPYPPANIRPYNTSNFVSTSSANSTPYPRANTMPYHVATNITSNLPNASSYRPANITPYHASNIAYRPANITSYQPANVTPYQPTRSEPSYLSTTRPSYATSTAPNSVSNDGPYGPANITPYRSLSNHSDTISIHSPPAPYQLPPNVLSSPFISAGSWNSHLSGTNSGFTNTTYSPQLPSQTLNRMGNTIPKSILRNTSSNRL